MTVSEWLARREPTPPLALREMLDRVLQNELARDASGVPELFLREAEQLTAALIGRDCTTRDSAMDLLTVDALVTYAFEAAADRTGELAPLAADAMRRIASIGAGSRAHETTA